MRVSSDDVTAGESVGYTESETLRDKLEVVVTLVLERFPVFDTEVLALRVPRSLLALVLTDTIWVGVRCDLLSDNDNDLVSLN